MKKLDLSIVQYNINGIIQFGSDGGKLANYYHSLGTHKVLWIDENSDNYGELYEATRSLGMEQNYVFYDRLKVPFKEWWRKNISWCDIETYDMIFINHGQNQRSVLEGFQNLLSTIRLVYFGQGVENDCHRFMIENGYQVFEYKTSNTEHVYGECYYIRK
jgi:hypothetical protein